MKKLILTITFVVAAATAHSQILITLLLGDKLNSDKIEFGLAGGLSVTSLTGFDQGENRSGFNLGFYFDIRLKEPSLFLNTGVMVKSPCGIKALPVYSLDNAELDAAFEGGQVNRTLSYFYVPVNIKYVFDNSLWIKGGITGGLLHKGTDTFVNTVEDTQDLEFKTDVRKLYHPIDFGLSVGAGYRLLKGSGMNIGVHYYFGLIDACIDDSGPSQFNRALLVTASIPIGKTPSK